MDILRIAMIGCGRAAESLHLPAASLASGVEVTVLVDRAVERARDMAGKYGVNEVRESPAEAAALADAAVVALPHHLHAPVTRELLEAGLHVLVEKPLALSVAECEELGELAEQRGLVLAVGMIRRSFPAARFVKRALEKDLLGDIRRVVLREGAPFAWEVASDFTFRRDSGGGVLADSGIHVLDLLSWWFGEPEVLAYRDDAAGGVEAECEVELRFPGGAEGFVELSRTRDLGAAVSVEGSKGRLTAGTGFDGQLELDLGGDPLVGVAQPRERSYGNVRELFIEQLEAFALAAGEGLEPMVGARDGAVGVRLLERCRQRREELLLPWARVPRGVAA